MVMILMALPALERFLMKVTGMKDAGEDSVAGRKEVGCPEKNGQQENDAGTGGDAGKEREKESADGTPKSKKGPSPEHSWKGVCEEVGGCRREDQETEREEDSNGL